MVVFLFPGQGSQKVKMGEDFYNNFSLAKEMVEEASDRIKVDFKKLLFEPNEKLNQSRYTQPAILLVSLIAHKLFTNQKPITPQYALGHSLGEFSALGSVGALEFGDAIELVHKRGELMENSNNGGMMVVLGLEDEVVEKIINQAQAEGKKVWCANYNSDGQIVIAGVKEDLKALEPIFKEAKAKRAMLLNMNTASHCPLLEPARKPLREYLEKFVKDSFQAPIISNVTAKPYNSKEEAIPLLERQLVEPVRYKQSIRPLNPTLFIEFGEGCVLKGLNRRITKVPTLCIKDSKSLEEALEKVEG